MENVEEAQETRNFTRPKPLSEDPLDGGGIILTESKVGIVNPPRG